MKPIIQALGYFALMIVVYTVTTFIAILLMTMAGVAVVPGVFLATGVLTVVLSIIAAVMSYHYWDMERWRHKLEHDQDHEYRMELLRIAEEENRGLEEKTLQLPMESQDFRYEQAS